MALFEEAKIWISTCYGELGKSEKEKTLRLQEIRDEIVATGSYTLTKEEIEHGARVAWRNSNRCIGRLFWPSLHVMDAREAITENEVIKALFYHITYATNNGKIRPALTIFHPRVKIYNHQLIRYAGYREEDRIVGDPDSLSFTSLCTSLGWKSKKTDYDLLPLVFSVDDQAPRWVEIPKEIVLEVPITHPEQKDWESLLLRWYAVPIIADMQLEIGGIIFSTAPFNGWYMETEIGARNLADQNRYNKLPAIAELMGLATSHDATLWKDRALVELNVAVLHSYKKQGVMIVDHHTAAKQFMLFEQQEKDHSREVTGEWSWLIPPVSPATTAIFHQDFDNTWKSPNFIRRKADELPR